MSTALGKTAAANVRAASHLNRAISALSRIYSRAEAAWDWINAAREMFDLFQFDPSDIMDLTASLKTSLLRGGHLHGKVELELPNSIHRKLYRMLGSFSKIVETQAGQEWIGTLGAVLVGKALGFEATSVGTGYHGIDGILHHDQLGYMIVESKGGKGTLAAGQMSEEWIRKNLRKLARANQNDDFAEQVRRNRPMLAMVVKLDLGKQKEHLAVRIQTYPRIKAWGSPFE